MVMVYPSASNTPGYKAYEASWKAHFAQLLAFHNRGELAPARFEQLNRLGFSWESQGY